VIVQDEQAVRGHLTHTHSFSRARGFVAPDRLFITTKNFNGYKG